MIPHQVCQVGLVSTHELPLLANGSNPVVNRFVQILPDILLQVVSGQKEKYKSSFKTHAGGVRKQLNGIKSCRGYEDISSVHLTDSSVALQSNT